MLEAVANVDGALWGFERIASFKAARVGSLVPQGFDRYARIFHPGWRMEGQRRVPVRWGDMAACTGRRAHALMHWDAIAPPHMTETEPPDEGTMPREVALPLLDIFLRHTRRGPCWLGVWSGYGRDSYRAHVPQPAASFDSGGGREWDLFRAPLDEAFLPVIGPPFEQTANLIWDANRSWWLTTDIEFNSSYIGGGELLIQALLDSDELETWPVAAADGIADPDPLNPDTLSPLSTRRPPPWRWSWREIRLSLPQFRVHTTERRSTVFRPRKRRDK